MAVSRAIGSSCKAVDADQSAPVLGEQLDEGRAVACSALQFLGWRYRITRELFQGTVDCSTLISQAYWLGAGIRIPFRADAQRNDPRAFEVSRRDLQAADLIFAYRSGAESPGGKHNHVAMYVGKDSMGIDWVIESRDPDGVRVTELGSAKSDGGFRRYCWLPTLHSVESGWKDLAIRTSKLGRLGARLTSAMPGHHRRHLGTDILLDNELPLQSPVDGCISRVLRDKENDVRAIEIRESSPYSTLHVLGPIGSFLYEVGTEIARGDLLGRTSSKYIPGCNIFPATRGRHRLHWEIWSDRLIPIAQDPVLRSANRATSIGSTLRRDSLRACNPVYLTKLDVAGSPIPLIPRLESP